MNQPNQEMIVRIVQTPRNKNGFILREISSGQVGFITECDKWGQIAQGQVWEAQRISTGPTYFRAKLIKQQHHQS